MESQVTQEIDAERSPPHHDPFLGGAGTVLAFMPQIVILTVAMEVLEASGYRPDLFGASTAAKTVA